MWVRHYLQKCLGGKNIVIQGDGCWIGVCLPDRTGSVATCCCNDGLQYHLVIPFGIGTVHSIPINHNKIIAQPDIVVVQPCNHHPIGKEHTWFGLLSGHGCRVYWPAALCKGVRVANLDCIEVIDDGCATIGLSKVSKLP